MVYCFRSFYSHTSLNLNCCLLWATHSYIIFCLTFYQLCFLTIFNVIINKVELTFDILLYVSMSYMGLGLLFFFWLLFQSTTVALCYKDVFQYTILIPNFPYYTFLSFQFSSVVQLCPTLRLHEPQHARPPCPSPIPGAHPNSCPLSR